MNKYIQFVLILVIVGWVTYWFLKNIQREAKAMKFKKIKDPIKFIELHSK